MPPQSPSPPTAKLSIDDLISRKGQPLSSETLDTASVVLLWPYSSLSHRISLVLAEPPFHAKRVCISFSGPAADAIAHSGVSVGDLVRLCLDGAQWEERRASSSDAKPTLLFRGRLKCEVRVLECENLYVVGKRIDVAKRVTDYNA